MTLNDKGRYDLLQVQRQLLQLRQEVYNRPLRVPTNGGTPAAIRRARIVGGNPLASGLEALQYAASVTPLAVYDPDVTTAYPTGLGNAVLYVDGVAQANKVLVRHAFTGDQSPILAGRMVSVYSTETLTYLTDTMTAYLVDWL